MATESVIALLAHACLDADAADVIDAESSPADYGAYLARHGVGAADAEALLAKPRRLAIYRRLVRNNLAHVTFRMLPRTRARLNDQGDDAFDATFDAFLEEVGPRTHYLRDVPHELLAFALPRWAARADLPRYALDLARHELLEFRIGAAPASAAPAELADVALDRPLVFAEPMELARYDHAVHELPADEDDRTAAPARPTTLLVYRDAEHRVRFLELTPLAASLVEELTAGQSVATGLAAACARHGAPMTPELLESIARFLADLGERGVLLGARP